MSTAEISQIAIAGLKVGIMGWQPALAAAQALANASEEDTAQFLFATLKNKNYFPSSAAAEYRQAFFREDKKARGEQVVEDAGACPSRSWGRAVPPAVNWSSIS